MTALRARPQRTPWSIVRGLGLAAAVAVALASPARTEDAVIVGAGISGLSAGLEAARGGARVTIVDVWSIFGGHAVMAHGGLCIVGSPLQESLGTVDTPDLAFGDFVEWGEDPDRDWVRYYVDHSRTEIYDWLTAMGVEFGGLVRYPGNSVARFHEPKGRGLGLASPIYRECLRSPNISFRWNFRVTALLRDGGRVVGVRGTDVRTGKTAELPGRHVVLATGGFQSNLDMVRAYWPREVRFPEAILVGSGVNSVGEGHSLARAVGATFHRMDHQWNYATGIPDPRYPGLSRGLNANNKGSIWVNAEGKRFVNELASDKFTFPALLAQPGSSYWAIFDEKAKKLLWVSGSDWADFSVIERVLYGNPELVKSRASLAALAEAASLPPDRLVESVRRFNSMVDAGSDSDFGRFGPPGAQKPAKVETPPFYAMRFFPLTRKSMGGVAIDRSCRVLGQDGQAIPGLLAVGELTGLAGINGRAGLEGTFLGPSILTGRVAGRTVLAEIARDREPEPILRPTPQPPTGTRPATGGALAEECAACHRLASLLSRSRTGYSHFEKAHRVVRERSLDCGQCHAEMHPFKAGAHRIDRLAQIATCQVCHVALER